MSLYSHYFIDKYKGMVGFGFDRETDEASLIVYLQKFSDDDFMDVMRKRLEDGEIEELFLLISRLLKKHLNEEEYHRLFLKSPEGT
ncbi:MAG: cytoplasmic protein [Deltaproteobacteria bacterium]|nr:cytoplasmic protein [Deltaproteobacteria bacterium]MBW2051271.1 cytoplasmic protein [Deltaproteobacteria bacterium]MBW2139919.1 cytoplasmic protein [Deltaproteobacteria bacterium]MBW2322384.1 cytoplasmic protein [Deltaproteobacteria bacterium]